MRKKLVLPIASAATGLGLAALVIASSISSPGIAKDNYEERLDMLETRVAVLEEEVGIVDLTSETSETNQSSQQSNVSSSSSSQTSVSQSSSGSAGSYSASFTSSGDNSFEVEINDSGSYTLVVAAGSAFEAELLDTDGQLVPAFSLSADKGGSRTATGELQPGLYTLRVQSDEMLNVTMMSTSD